ncbi:MAG: heparinase II/III family protein [Bryobacteraceae bacterium]
MRSFAEISFRARQEAANLFLLARQPRFSGAERGTLHLPNPVSIADALRGSEYAGEVIATAEQILGHRFPLLAVEIETGREIQWRRDYRHDKESAIAYFRRIPYLEFSAVGDHKFIWELNRHQHLVLLAQAHLLTHDQRYTEEIFRQIDSWIDQNPFQRGINWTSALEVAFRALSWIWVYHFVGSEMSDRFRRTFLTALYRHGRHLYQNLSVYFSPNTHLLGEAVALYALGVLFPNFKGAEQWRARAGRIVLAQLDFQMKPDGSHFEQSTYYHVYAVDFFVLFYLLAGRPAEMNAALLRMAEYLHALLGSNRQISFQGDDDGGRLFHPYGARDQFGRATLGTCGILFDRNEWIGTGSELAQQAAWWLGGDVLEQAADKPRGHDACRYFPDSGALFLRNDWLALQMDCGPFGYGGAGHSHSDTLSIVLESGDERILVDPGTYAYMGDPAERNWFRGSEAHSTVRVNATDQGAPAGPFRWSSKPCVTMRAWKATADGCAVDAECTYAGFSHRRRARLAGARLVVLDEIEGPGDLACEQIWQLGSGSSRFSFQSSGQMTSKDSWYSPGYGLKLPGRALLVETGGESRVRIATTITAGTEGTVLAFAEAAREIEEILS